MIESLVYWIIFGFLIFLLFFIPLLILGSFIPYYLDKVLEERLEVESHISKQGTKILDKVFGKFDHIPFMVLTSIFSFIFLLITFVETVHGRCNENGVRETKTLLEFIQVVTEFFMFLEYPILLLLGFGLLHFLVIKPSSRLFIWVFDRKETIKKTFQEVDKKKEYSMKFYIYNTSDDETLCPVEGAIQGASVYVDRQGFKSPEDYEERLKVSWFSEGINHKVTEKGIERTFPNRTATYWTIEITSLEELLELKDKVGHRLILSTNNRNGGEEDLPALMIYDDYIE